MIRARIKLCLQSEPGLGQFVGGTGEGNCQRHRRASPMPIQLWQKLVR